MKNEDLLPLVNYELRMDITQPRMMGGSLPALSLVCGCMPEAISVYGGRPLGLPYYRRA
jgi:hypothetical protein